MSGLQGLAERPFELLIELERRARAAIAAREGAPAAADEWVGIADMVESAKVILREERNFVEVVDGTFLRVSG